MEFLFNMLNLYLIIIPVFYVLNLILFICKGKITERDLEVAIVSSFLWPITLAGFFYSFKSDLKINTEPENCIDFKTSSFSSILSQAYVDFISCTRENLYDIHLDYEFTHVPCYELDVGKRVIVNFAGCFLSKTIKLASNKSYGTWSNEISTLTCDRKIPSRFIEAIRLLTINPEKSKIYLDQASRYGWEGKVPDSLTLLRIKTREEFLDDLFKLIRELRSQGC